MNKSFSLVLSLVALSVVLYALSLPAPAFYYGEVDARHAAQG